MPAVVKRIFILSLYLLIVFPLPASEFWLQPEKFISRRGETINVRFWIGKKFNGHNWRGNSSRVRSLRVYMASSRDDLSSNLSEQLGDSLQLAIFDEGTAMITFNSTNTYTETEASEFNEYLKEDALQNAIEYREVNGETGMAGKEFYQRSVKTLIQVGSKSNSCYRQITDLPLDIIPLANPYTLRNNQRLRVKVLFKNKPLANHCFKLWHRTKNSTRLQDVSTNASGETSFRVQKRGKWMLSTVAMNRLDDDSRADWQSYWGSLTWGYSTRSF